MKEDEQLYICEKAKDPRCCHCRHSEPHEKEYKHTWHSWSNGLKADSCTKYAECYDETGNDAQFKCRCIKVKNENS